MTLPLLRPTFAEVDLTRLLANLARIRHTVGPQVKLLVLVKANAYGHGAVAVSRFVQEEKLGDFLGVASVEEGIELREAGITLPILVLGSLYPFEAFEQAITHRLSVTIASLEAANAVCRIAEKLGKTAHCHVKQDTGMGRIGTRRGKVMDVLERLHNKPHIVLEGFFSHLSSVETDPAFTEEQIGYYRDTLTNMQLRGMTVHYRHLAASAAIDARPDIHYDMVRPGHSVYGLEPGYQPVLSLKTRVVYVKDVSTGGSISYGRSFRAEKPMKVATLPIGYGDGYLRALSNKAEVLIKGKRCRVLGNITMDMMMVDITHVSPVQVGEEVVVVGRQGLEEITLKELANLAGTIDYELCTLITARVPRIYKK